MENMNTPAMPEHSGKGGLIGLAVVLLIIGLISGYALGKKAGSGTLGTTTSPLPSSIDSTSNWQTYQDTQGYFTIQYPSQYIVSPLDPDDGRGHSVEIKGTSGFEILITVVAYEEIPDLKAYVDRIENRFEKDAQNSAAGVTFTQEPIIIDGAQGYALYGTESSAVANVDVTYYFVKNNNLYTLNSRFDSMHPETRDMIRNIVSTLHFTTPGTASALNPIRKFAQIFRVDEAAGKRTVTVDYEDWLTGAEADAYYRTVLGDAGGAPNGFAIRNSEITRTTLTISDTASFKIVNFTSDGAGQRTATFQEFKDRFGNDLYGSRIGWFTIQNGLVTAFEEQYTP